MTYPPQSGGWPDQSGGGWQAPDHEVYLDPASGQPVYQTAPQYSPGYAPYSPYLPPVPGPQRRTNGMSIAALVVSIVGLLTSFCYGVGLPIGLLGAIFGHIGLRQTRQRDEEGRGMAIAGVTIGWIAVAAGIIAIAVYVSLWLWFKHTVDNLPRYYPSDYPS